MRGMRRVLPLLLVVLALAADREHPGGAAALRAQGAPRVVLIVVDGLRPDQITADQMPRLLALGRRGMVFDDHHSVTPSVTRVNASSIATGLMPGGHGVLGNIVYSAATFPTRGVNTSSHEDLEAMARAEGRVLTGDTLGHMLARAGRRLVVFSAGSSGSAWLLSHPLAANGAVVNPDLVRPASLVAAVETAGGGPGPREAVPNTARNRWIVDAFRALGPTTLDADVTIMWFGDPDETAHQTGLGSSATAGALRAVDAEIGRLEDAIAARGRQADTTWLVTSDHGFSTHTGELRLAALVAPFARPLPDGSADLVVTEGAIHVRGAADAARVTAIVEALQARPEVGAIFTAPARDGALEGVVPGTLAVDVAQWRHARSAPILVSATWSDATNAAGVAGTTTQGGVAGHGTTSPFDIHAVLVAAGRDVRPGARGPAPTSNADLAPTILSLLGLPVPATMTGRVITELRPGGPAPGAIAIARRTTTSQSRDGRYEVRASVSEVQGTRYLDRTDVRRRP